MAMRADADLYLGKAVENLAAATADLAAARYNACASRCYYACFQARIAALLRAGIRPAGSAARWEHGFVQAQFTLLVNRRKLYSTSLRNVLQELQSLREIGDYRTADVSGVRAARAVRAVQQFLQEVGKQS